MEDEVAKQAANEMALREIDKFCFDQRIPSAVVAVSGEEGNIDVLAKSGIWLGDFCAQHIFVKATCSACQPELETLERKGGYTRSALKNVPSQHRAHHLEQQDMWMVLRVICWELECASRTDGGRQRPPGLTTVLGKGRREAKGELAHPRMKGARQKKSDRPERPEQQEEEWEAMQIEDEEDPWAGLGMDEAGETPPSISKNVESQTEDAVDPEEELSELRVETDENGDGIEEPRQNLPHEQKRLTENGVMPQMRSCQ